ncbi:chloride channel protein [Robertkochia marina]|uniref:Chloride channel protein n=1 Tax=Robertkochia marina TaxID=1227945 RepID=A0A4S3M526_9FLAO|nr:chloride channel protein [Robertkochia marina]THD70020.1 chloride channel protein [Robertkochia marina]TRZ47654.1 chloride channel protein [Robertkochia marina]
MARTKSKKNLITRFLIWKYKHISDKNFIYILSVIAGLLSGLVAVALKNLTHFIDLMLQRVLVRDLNLEFYFIFPIIGFSITLLIIKYGIRNKVSHGIPSTLFAISKRKGLMRRYQMFGSLLTAPITVGFGGSVGLEGPTVATGAAISSNISRLLHTNQASRMLLIGCAAAGAMSSIFKAPIAAIIFAVEVFSLDLTLASLLPLLLASLSGVITSYFFFGNDIILPFKVTDTYDIYDLPYYIILGVVAAMVSVYFSNIYERSANYFEKIEHPLRRLLLGGLALGLLLFLIPPLYGEGFEVINNLIQGQPEKTLSNSILTLDLSNAWIVIALLAGLVIFKIFAVTFTFGAGGVGGIFAPTLFMGSIMGYCLALFINTLNILPRMISTSNFTLVGMAGLLAGVLHAPLTAIFLIAELTGGYGLFVPLMITAAISYSITRYFVPHSVYAMELGRKGELITHNKDHAVLTLMDIESVVETNFIPVYPDMSLGEIVREAIVKSKRNIFPVLNRETNYLEGIILMDDLRPIMFEHKMYDEIFAQDLMNNPPTVIKIKQDKMTKVMKKFQDSGAWNLPVIKDGKYYGFVSKSKLLTAYRRKLIHLTR